MVSSSSTTTSRATKHCRVVESSALPPQEKFFQGKMPYKPIEVYSYEHGGMLQEWSEEKQETFKHCWKNAK